MVASRDANDHGITASAPPDRVDLVEPNQPRVGGKEPNMFIVVFVFSPCFRQIAMVDSTTGEIIERRLEH
jgi:hypothetical protein